MINVSWFVPETRLFPAFQKVDYNRVLPSVWIRCLQVLPYLEKRGIACQVNQLLPKTQLAIFLRCFDADHLDQMRTMKKNGIKVFLDTPVNYFSEADHLAFSGKAHKYFREMAELSDGILCASRYIQKAGEAKGFRTVYFPDSINVDWLNRKKERINFKNPVLIWCGNSAKASILNFLSPLTQELKWKWIIISEKKPKLDFMHKWIKWNYKQFPQQLMKADLGIFPRETNNEYDQGHSFFKIGVCLAGHIPVIYSPLPSYEEVANDSNSIQVQGLSIATWEKAFHSLEALCFKLDFHDNPVEAQYTTSSLSIAYADFLNRVLKS